MASTSAFSTLPTELLCRVFEFAADFTVVAALAQTARRFYQTWRQFPTPICQAVAPRVLLSLADAELLLDTQEEAEAIDKPQGTPQLEPINRVKRLLFNARCASAVTKNWIGLCEIEASFDRENDPMRQSEIARFQHAFYLVWTIGVISTAQSRHQALAFINKCSPRELCRLSELAFYAMYYNHNNFGSVGLDFQDEVWKTSCDLIMRRWVEVTQEGHYNYAVEEHTIAGFYVFFDETQKYLNRITDGQHVPW